MIKLDSMIASLCFAQIPNMRKNSFSIEEKMGKYYPSGSFTILAVNDNTPPEIPRMIGVSEKHHSQLQISANLVNLLVNFDDKYTCDFASCYQYVLERIECAEQCIRELTDELFYVGIAAQYVSEKEDPKKVLKENLFKIDTDEEVFDLLGKITIKKDDMYYVNLTLNNFRTNEQSELLGVNIDINDRYQYNFKKGSLSQPGTISKITDMHLSFANNNLHKLIEEGKILL